MHEELLEFLKKAYSPFHVVRNVEKILKGQGFIKLEEDKPFNLEKGQSYYVIRNLTSIIAFKVGKDISKDTHFQLVASHTDSPVLKIKEHIFNNVANVQKLTVEPYGGLIHSCWLDKPLSIAGRIVIQKENEIRSELINFDEDLCIIPNLAIHMNREINNGFTYNPQYDFCPIIGEATEDNILEYLITSTFKEGESLKNYDLYLYNREEPKLVGALKDFITSPKEDDLASLFATLNGFIEGGNDNVITVFAGFDNEEVGSTSINGANSSFLDSVLKRAYLSFFNDTDSYFASLAKSFLISADNAHAFHPNHMEKSENDSPVLLNKGVVIKHNANMHYCSDALSSSFVIALLKENGLNAQEFYNRSDIRGGSTLGNISISHVSILSVDIGLPQLAMHSNYETMGSKDYLDMIKLIQCFMNKNVILDNGNIKY